MNLVTVPAPQIGELYGTPSRFDQTISDPCSNDSTAPRNFLNDATVRANCIEAGVPANGSYAQPNPQISVEIDQYHSQNVFVMGEVRAPNKYSLPGNSTLMDVLTLAGSTTPNAGHWVLVNHSRRGVGPAPLQDSTSVADLKINLADIQSGKAQNIRIEDGDTIFVPKADRIYVTGQVRTPGYFTYDEDMTVFTAISLAGGLTEKGSNSRISIIRIEKGKRREIDAKQTDTLKPGDNVYVKARRL